VTFQEFPVVKLNKLGRILQGMEVKIFNPDADGIGEVCMRGRNIFMGYLNDAKSTKDVIDPDGYFHSGDLGYIDEDGYMEITGRIKELIITAGGENVSPLVIEHGIMESCPLFSSVMVVGDMKKFLIALITLKTIPD
jgi:long-chain-fatty-acid--CoA ligase ACSBG